MLFYNSMASVQSSDWVSNWASDQRACTYGRYFCYQLTYIAFFLQYCISYMPKVK
jgi:hypothetical protein